MFKFFFIVFFMGALSMSVNAELADEVNVRDGLGRSIAKFSKGGKRSVAFLGGSITEMDGYRPLVASYLQSRFPKAEFSFINAGLSSTCSTSGAFRLKNDVLSKGPIDLLFVDFAVNDDQDAHHSRQECVRGMEGVVRQFREANPDSDVVFVYFVNEGMAKTFNAGAVPLSIAAHEEVAKAYDVPSIDLARSVSRRMAAGEFDWAKFGGVHPAPFGNKIAADMIASLFAVSPNAKAPAPTPAPLDQFSYSDGRFLPFDRAKLSPGWLLHVPAWSSIPGHMRANFAKLPILESSTPGASLTLDFSGTAVGAFVLAGPDAGTVSVSVDGGPWRDVKLYHDFSGGLHYPRTVLFADGLPLGRHSLTLKISAEHDPRAKGNAARIMHFVVNGD